MRYAYKMRVSAIGLVATSVAGVLGLLAPEIHGAAECGPTAYDCGMYYVGRQDFSSAIRWLQPLVDKEPKNLKALHLLGIALTASGRLEDANSQFTRALKIDANFYPALRNLAINEVALKRTADAKAHFKQVLKIVPEDETTHLYLGEIEFAARQCGPALFHYNKSRSRIVIVNNPTLILHYGRCALEQNKRADALAMLALLPTTDPEAQFEAATMLAQFEAYAEAAKHFGEARKLSTDRYVAGYNQALAYLKAADFPAAVRTGEELISEGKETAELYNLLSEAQLKNGQLKEGYDALRRATQLAPKDEKNYVDLASLCMDYSNWDLALEITEIGLSQLPNSDRLYLQKGALWAMKGQIAEAEKEFQKAMDLAPQKTPPYIALSFVWMERGQPQKAIDLLRERIQKNSPDHFIYYFYAQALLRSGPLAGSEAENEAIAALERSIQLNPDWSPPRSDLGKILLRRGEIDRAISELERAVALDPTDSAPAYQLAQAYRKKGDPNKATALMAHFKEINIKARDTEQKKALWRLVREGVPASSRDRN